jgi:hypothetical protein
MNVFELLSTLRSMALALREANRVIHPTAPELRVAVRPVMEVSYEILLLSRQVLASGDRVLFIVLPSRAALGRRVQLAVQASTR